MVGAVSPRSATGPSCRGPVEARKGSAAGRRYRGGLDPPGALSVGAQLDEPAGVHHGESIAKPTTLAQVVGDDQDRHPEFECEAGAAAPWIWAWICDIVRGVSAASAISRLGSTAETPSRSWRAGASHTTELVRGSY
jgi:hypothetical protein